MAVTPTVFFVALECEARPLIDLWKLKKTDQIGVIKIFSKDLITIVICGVGSKNMLIAAGYFMGKNPTFFGHFINFGIAGHASLPLGTLCSVYQVKADQNLITYHLNPAINFPSKMACLSFSSAQHAYQENYLHDMEAFSFVEALSTFHPIDCLHVFKVVSDGPSHPQENLSAKKVIDLIEPIKKEVAKLIAMLPPISNSQVHELLKKFSEKVTLSESEQIIAKKYLEKASALNIPVLIDSLNTLAELKNFVELAIDRRFSL